jgi:D-amino-acid dehydrogenase
MPLLQSLFNRHAAMKLHWGQLPALLGWGVNFLRHASPAKHRAITKANFALADYSTRQTEAMAQKLNLQFERAAPGTIKLLRSAQARDAALRLADMLSAQGLAYEVLERAQVVEREPALHQATELFGGLYFPDDRVGNARLFCKELTEAAVRLGGRVRLNRPVTRLLRKNGVVMGVALADEQIFGEVVLAAGAMASSLAAPLGLKLPIRPAKGYSLTLQSDADMPVYHPLVDPHLHIAVTPLPGRLRLLGMAEFAGFDKHINPQRAALLRRFFERLMPQLAARLDWHSADIWAGLRPMSADGRPFIGASKLEGLWLNCGHGHLGWTMAVGSAKLLADEMMGQKPEINPSPFAASR